MVKRGAVEILAASNVRGGQVYKDADQKFVLGKKLKAAFIV